MNTVSRQLTSMDRVKEWRRKYSAIWSDQRNCNNKQPAITNEPYWVEAEIPISHPYIRLNWTITKGSIVLWRNRPYSTISLQLWRIVSLHLSMSAREKYRSTAKLRRIQTITVSESILIWQPEHNPRIRLNKSLRFNCYLKWSPRI